MFDLKYLYAKLQKYKRIPAIKNSSISPKAFVCPGCNLVDVRMGDYSYAGNETTICFANIGKYCSIGSYVSIGGGVHPLDNLSTSPVFHRGANVLKKNFSDLPRPSPKLVEIGNDVWIGDKAFVSDGVKIGNGAVVGAHAVVTHDVPPYAIVAGCPARILRYRFSDETISQLNDSEWWNLSEEKIASLAKYAEDPEVFLSQLELIG